MTATYDAPPHTGNRGDYDVVVDAPFDDVWKELIQYSAGAFFAIDNYEKDSGLITLSFTGSPASEFVTGGHWTVEGSTAFDGEYVDFVTQNSAAHLAGKINIVVAPSNSNQTRVTVNVRYIFTVPPQPNIRGTTWIFNSGGCDTQTVPNPALGPGTPMRTLCPTHKAEGAIIDAVS